MKKRNPHGRVFRSRILNQLARITFLTALGLGSGAYAAETVTGPIDSLYAAAGSNFGYRVNLTGVKACSATNNAFAYTNVSDDNYKAYIANLTLAYAMGAPVTLVTEQSNGCCHILEVYFHR